MTDTVTDLFGQKPAETGEEQVSVIGWLHGETKGDVRNPGAYLIFDGNKSSWVPKILVDFDGHKKFTMPKWLAKNRGFFW